MRNLLIGFGMRGCLSLVLLSVSLVGHGAKYSGDLVDGVREGVGSLAWDNGDVYEGQFKAGKRHGNGRLVWASGEVYEGEFAAGKRTGYGIYSWSNGQSYEGEWVDDQPDGQGFCFNPAGSRRCQFVAGEEVAFEGGRRDQIFNGNRPEKLGVYEGKLTPCPNSPNCASSQEARLLHSIQPIEFVGTLAQTMARIREVLEAEMDRIVVRVFEDDYIYAEAQTAALHFIDDLEFYCVDAEKICHVRSASRIGYSDLGVNLSRLREIRKRVDPSVRYFGNSAGKGPRK